MIKCSTVTNSLWCSLFERIDTLRQLKMMNWVGFIFYTYGTFIYWIQALEKTATNFHNGFILIFSVTCVLLPLSGDHGLTSTPVKAKCKNDNLSFYHNCSFIWKYKIFCLKCVVVIFTFFKYLIPSFPWNIK